MVICGNGYDAQDISTTFVYSAMRFFTKTLANQVVLCYTIITEKDFL